jgi:hypothetical protein
MACTSQPSPPPPPCCHPSQMLDLVMLLAKGSRVYFGTPQQAPAFAASVGLPCPVGRPIAEHLLQMVSQPQQLLRLVAASDQQGQKQEEEQQQQEGQQQQGQQQQEGDQVGDGRDAAPALAARDQQHTAAGPAAVATPAALPGHLTNKKAEHSRRHLTKASPHSPVAASRRSLGRELATLFWRAGADTARTPGLLLMHLALALLSGLLVGLIFLHQQFDLAGAQNRAGALFFSLAFFGFTSLTVIDGLMLEQRVVGREVAGGYHWPWTYLATKLLLDGLLLRALPAAVYTALMYPLVGLNSSGDRVAVFLFTLAAFACSIGALAVAVAALTGSTAKATLLLNLLLLLWVLVGGYLVNPGSIPAWLRWLRWLSPLSFAFQAMYGNEFRGQYYDFGVEGYEVVRNVKGETFVAALGMDPYHLGRDVGLVIAFYGGFSLLALGLFQLRGRRG